MGGAGPGQAAAAKGDGREGWLEGGEFGAGGGQGRAKTHMQEGCADSGVGPRSAHVGAGLMRGDVGGGGDGESFGGDGGRWGGDESGRGMTKDYRVDMAGPNPEP